MEHHVCKKYQENNEKILMEYCEKHGMYGKHLNTCPTCFGETALGENGKLKPERYFGANIEIMFEKDTCLYTKEELEECKKRISMSESKEQIKVIQWAKRQREKYPEIRWLHHIPNGGLRNINVASKLKLEGVESGVFDLFLPVQKWKKNGLYIEMKVGKNKLTDKQIEFKQFVIGQNYATAVCYSAEEGIRILKKYLGIK